MVLPRRSDALRLLQRVRDETHRFATTQNQKLRSKENGVSRFEKLPNIGKKRAKLIYKTWKTLSAFEAVCKSAPEEVSETLAMPLSKVEEARLEAKILLQEAAEKQQTAKAAGVTGMVRPHSKENSFTEELARQAPETSYLSSLAASALEDTLEAAEPEPDYQ